MIDPYISALERALPATDTIGRRYAVLSRTSSSPNTPLAVFQYEHDAYEWAREAFGKFEGFRFIMPAGIEVLPVGALAVKNMKV